jgi:hypothetical protein
MEGWLEYGAGSAEATQAEGDRPTGGDAVGYECPVGLVEGQAHQAGRSATAITPKSARTFANLSCAASAVSAVQPMPPRSMAASISTRWKRKLS